MYAESHTDTRNDTQLPRNNYSLADDRIAILKAGDEKRFFRRGKGQSLSDSEAQLGPDTNASDTMVEATTVYDEMLSNDLIFAINFQASDDNRMCLLQRTYYLPYPGLFCTDLTRL